jgi:hypothetical protein
MDIIITIINCISPIFITVLEAGSLNNMGQALARTPTLCLYSERTMSYLSHIPSAHDRTRHRVDAQSMFVEELSGNEFSK